MKCPKCGSETNDFYLERMCVLHGRRDCIHYRCSCGFDEGHEEKVDRCKDCVNEFILEDPNPCCDCVRRGYGSNDHYRQRGKMGGTVIDAPVRKTKRRALLDMVITGDGYWKKRRR